MKEIRVLKLGTKCRDRATGLEGFVTHWAVNMDGDIQYVFQPRGLNGEGQPFDQMYFCGARLVAQSSDFETVEVPFEILGTSVKDTFTEFTGLAVAFIRHMGGCFHVTIQPSGCAPNGGAIDAMDFDLRRCEGEMIKPIPEEKAEEDRRKKPSPSPVDSKKLIR